MDGAEDGRFPRLPGLEDGGDKDEIFPWPHGFEDGGGHSVSSTRALHAPRAPGRGEQMPKSRPSAKVGEAPVEQRAKAAAQFEEQSNS